MIKFEKPKKRAIFLRDMVCLNIALSLVEVGSKADDFNGELKVLHKNKQRKELKQLKDKLEYLKSKQREIYSQLDYKDLQKFKRNDVHDCLKFFTKSWGIGKITLIMNENKIMCTDVEKELASKLIKEIERV